MSDNGSNLNPFFKTDLFLTLKLEADGKEEELPAGNIESVCLNLHSYGYGCNLQFATFDKDEVYEILTSLKIIKATLTFKSLDPKETEPIIEFKGILTDRNFKRLPEIENKQGQVHRVYEITFFDHAKVIWENHSITEIYVDASMKEIIEKNGSEVTMDFKWDPLEIKHPLIAFSLEEKYLEKPDPEKQTNFYSFLIWYLHKENGILLYDYKTNSYTITGKKKEASGPALEVSEWFVTPPICLLSRPVRYNERIHQLTADTLVEVDKENPHAFKSARKEFFDPKDYRLYPEHAHQKVHSTLNADKNEIEVELTNFTEDIQLDKLTPGSFICFKGNKEGNWSSDACFKEKNFRIRHLYFVANKIDASDETYKPIQVFQMFVKARLEEEDETFIEWPKYNPPAFPFYVPGTVFCDIKEDAQSNYTLKESEKTPQGEYLVIVHLEKEKRKVSVPFEPFTSSDNFNPFRKDTKVSLEMDFHTAKIVRVIAFGPLACLTAGLQGNQNIFASNGEDKYTLMRHEYVDGKDSVLTIQQSSSKEQKQTLEIKEKDILVSVDEKGKKTIFMQLNQDVGVVLSREDKDAGSHQQTVFDGTSMTHTCKGSEGTSVIIQKPDSVSIECKNFSIKSETFLVDASDSIMMQATNSFDAKAKIANVVASAVKHGG